MAGFPNYFSPTPWERALENERRWKEMQDFIIGFVVGQVTMIHVGLWSIGIGILTGALWYLGGKGWLGFNTWRRIGVPAMIVITVVGARHQWLPYLISFPMMYGALSIGYGVPDVNDTEGSWLGRRFGKHTRKVWYLILIVSMIPLFLQ